MEVQIPRAYRKAMPHVATQWQEEEFQLQQMSGFHKKSNYPRSDPPRTQNYQPNNVHQRPSLRVLAPSPKWDNEQRLDGTDYTEPETPESSVESIFELTSEDSIESPNSSNDSYYLADYLAELEDTSLPAPEIPSKPRIYANTMPRRTRPLPMEIEPRYPANPSPIPPATMEFRTAQMTSRAVIKVIDETIAAIEDTNRQLLSRALAAEEIAQMMQERNLELEFKIKHYSQPQYRPKTAPAQPAHSRHRSANNLVSAYNDSMLQCLPPKRQTKSQLPPPRDPNFTTHTTLSRPMNPERDLTSTSQYHSLHRSPDTNISTTTHAPYRAPLQQLSPSYANVRVSANTSQQQQQQTHLQPPPTTSCSSHISPTIPYHPSSPPLISLAEARKRAASKPLPPLGPMSPSVLRGVVEIGTDTRNAPTKSVGMVKYDLWGGGRDKMDDSVVDKRKRGLSGLFSRRKREECFF